jgi:hypothetical protein
LRSAFLGKRLAGAVAARKKNCCAALGAGRFKGGLGQAIQEFTAGQAKLACRHWQIKTQSGDSLARGVLIVTEHIELSFVIKFGLVKPRETKRAS